MNTYEIPIIASSSEVAGATNISDLGSEFEIQLRPPLHFPEDMENCTVECQEVNVWWTIPNISENLGNNKLYVQYNLVDYVITIPDGLYSVTELNAAVDRELSMETGESGLVTIEPDNATQRILLTLTQSGLQIDFTPNDTFRDILGFDARLVPETGPTTELFFTLGDMVAAFNTIEYFLLHADIVDQGIRVNDDYTQTIAQVLITVNPGSQIISAPFNPPKSLALTLAGQTIDRIKFWLTDQNNNLVDTNGEVFGTRMIIKYTRAGL